MQFHQHPVPNKEKKFPFNLYPIWIGRAVSDCTEVGTIWGRPESTWDAQVLVTLLSAPILETKWTWTWSTTVALNCKVRNAKTKKMQRRTRCPNPRDSAGGSYFGELPPGADSHGPSTLAGTNLNRENCTFSERDPCQIANSPASIATAEKECKYSLASWHATHPTLNLEEHNLGIKRLQIDDFVCSKRKFWLEKTSFQIFKLPNINFPLKICRGI